MAPVQTDHVLCMHNSVMQHCIHDIAAIHNPDPTFFSQGLYGSQCYFVLSYCARDRKRWPGIDMFVLTHAKWHEWV